MAPTRTNTFEQTTATIHCPSCGGSMRVADVHMQAPVACPHCNTAIDPWRFLPTLASGQAPPVHPPTPPPAGQAPPMPGAFPPGYGQQADMWAGYSWRNRWIAGALAILLGVFGVHRFYMGSKGIGFVQLGITVCSFGAFAGVVYVWAWIEGILCFCGAMHDADGLPLRG